MDKFEKARASAASEVESIHEKWKKLVELETKVLLLMNLSGLELKDSDKSQLESIVKYYISNHEPTS